MELAARLREALATADFTYDAVAELLGPLAHDALGRNETTPGLRRTADGSVLSTLVRLFLLQAPVSLAEAERALPGLIDRLAVQGFLEQSVSQVAARLDIRPYAADDGDLWVVSDLTPGLDGTANRVVADHVLGISPASTSLAQMTLRGPVGTSLDLGTGCGVQALHLARHSERVVATDVNSRALKLASFNAALNGLAERIDVRDGSFFAPVQGERFDLIATNPPFVISPATGERLVYRDSGLPGDRVVEDIVRAAPAHLTPGGVCQILGNWAILAGTPWQERLASWVPEDCDALVVQREIIDPAAYVELWLKDAGQHPSTGALDAAEYQRRYDTWLSWFEEQGVEAIGFGWLNLRSAGSGARELIEWPYDVEQPIAPALGAWFGACAAEVGPDTVLRLADGVQQETFGEPGAEDPATIVVRQQRGLRRARPVDTIEAAFLGASDGTLPVGRLLDAIASLVEQDAAQVRASYLPALESLVREGYLVAQG